MTWDIMAITQFIAHSKCTEAVLANQCNVCQTYLNIPGMMLNY